MNKSYTRIAFAAAWIAMGCISLGTEFAHAQSAERRCVRTSQIRQTRRSADGTFIDFHMTGRTVFRNTLRNRCPGLRNSGFGYRTPNGSLCSGNIIRLLRNGSTCVLGTFTDVTSS